MFKKFGETFNKFDNTCGDTKRLGEQTGRWNAVSYSHGPNKRGSSTATQDLSHFSVPEMFTNTFLDINPLFFVSASANEQSKSFPMTPTIASFKKDVTSPIFNDSEIYSFDETSREEGGVHGRYPDPIASSSMLTVHPLTSSSANSSSCRRYSDVIKSIPIVRQSETFYSIPPSPTDSGVSSTPSSHRDNGQWKAKNLERSNLDAKKDVTICDHQHQPFEMISSLTSPPKQTLTIKNVQNLTFTKHWTGLDSGDDCSESASRSLRETFHVLSILSTLFMCSMVRSRVENMNVKLPSIPEILTTPQILGMLITSLTLSFIFVTIPFITLSSESNSKIVYHVEHVSNLKRKFEQISSKGFSKGLISTLASLTVLIFILDGLSVSKSVIEVILEVKGFILEEDKSCQFHHEFFDHLTFDVLMGYDNHPVHTKVVNFLTDFLVLIIFWSVITIVSSIMYKRLLNKTSMSVTSMILPIMFTVLFILESITHSSENLLKVGKLFGKTFASTLNTYHIWELALFSVLKPSSTFYTSVATLFIFSVLSSSSHCMSTNEKKSSCSMNRIVLVIALTAMTFQDSLLYTLLSVEKDDMEVLSSSQNELIDRHGGGGDKSIMSQMSTNPHAKSYEWFHHCSSPFSSTQQQQQLLTVSWQVLYVVAVLVQYLVIIVATHKFVVSINNNHPQTRYDVQQVQAPRSLSFISRCFSKSGELTIRTCSVLAFTCFIVLMSAPFVWLQLKDDDIPSPSHEISNYKTVWMKDTVTLCCSVVLIYMMLAVTRNSWRISSELSWMKFFSSLSLSSLIISLVILFRNRQDSNSPIFQFEGVKLNHSHGSPGGPYYDEKFGWEIVKVVIILVLVVQIPLFMIYNWWNCFIEKQLMSKQNRMDR